MKRILQKFLMTEPAVYLACFTLVIWVSYVFPLERKKEVKSEKERCFLPTVRILCNCTAATAVSEGNKLGIVLATSCCSCLLRSRCVVNLIRSS